MKPREFSWPGGRTEYRDLEPTGRLQLEIDEYADRDMMFALNDVLGYDDERIGELLVSGALE